MATPQTDGVIWDLTLDFPAIDSPEFRAFRDHVEARYKAHLDQATALGTLTVANAAKWAQWILAGEDIVRDHSHMASFVGCHAATDSNNESVKSEQARLARLSALARKASIPFQAALREATDEAFDALLRQPDAAGIEYPLRREREDARRRMDIAREMLAADLSVDGISAWSILYNTISGQLTFELEQSDGTIEEVPMSRRQSLLQDPDPEVRRRVFASSNAAWESMAEPIAAALNAIAGTRLTLNAARGVDHFLDVAMFQAGVQQPTIDAMIEGVLESADLTRRYLALKARAMGVDKLGFQDLGAPLKTGDEQRLTWAEGVAHVLAAFDASYPALGQYARTLFDGNRVDSLQRPGKRPGAFCTSSFRALKSRVCMNYGGTWDDVRTLAHEIGHAWHNHVMVDMRPNARFYPMTLAETASTFAEDLVGDALLRSPDTPDAMRFKLLHQRLDNAATYLLNIPMRYLFEKRFTEERQAGVVPISRLRALMEETQAECYGEILDPEQRDPWFWASKLHFYISGTTFYNFPYTFGFLFSSAIGARFRAEGPAFLDQYERLLRLTASAGCEDVARVGLGVDITRKDFWKSTVESLRPDIEQFESLVAARA